MLKNVNSLDVYYEDVFMRGTATKKRVLKELCRHIDFSLRSGDMDEHIEDYTGMKRHQNPENIYKLIPNWQEVQEHFNVEF